MPDRRLLGAEMTEQVAYRPLKTFVAKRGGVRLAFHGGLRDRLVDMIVAEWPENCPNERIEEVVRARVARRVRDEYGSVIAMFLIGVLANAIIKIVIEWWLARNSHRVLMEGWRAQARP